VSRQRTAAIGGSMASASRQLRGSFLDPLHISRYDRIVEGEESWQTIGMVNGVLLILVAHTVVEKKRRSFVSSQHEGSLGRSESNMKKRTKSKMVAYQLKPDQRLTSRQKREIQNLAAMPEDQIDTSDIPELPPVAWKNAVRGKWYRPLKKAVSIRLDADVLAWLKAKGSGYQTKVNSLLRERMLKEIIR
jgi:uncharacterized protein (DUF4415 family)